MTVWEKFKDKSVSIALACATVTAVAVISLLPGWDERRRNKISRFHSWEHLLAFAVVAYVVARVTRPSRVRAVLFLVSVVLGFGPEYGEHSVLGNPVEWEDL